MMRYSISLRLEKVAIMKNWPIFSSSVSVRKTLSAQALSGKTSMGLGYFLGLETGAATSSGVAFTTIKGTESCSFQAGATTELTANAMTTPNTILENLARLTRPNQLLMLHVKN